jgi:tetratricopeptide (TPR) repeat protein
MTRAFIIRPFGVKEGVNFDAVDERLIQPALARIGVSGNTTTEIVEQGNIREDMFRLLVCADLVIADISIHNANVFYELGIRHGMRPNATFLLRANVDEYPFDLHTDRYLAYDRDDPASSVTALASALKATLDSSRVDSPVYQVLPNLKAPDATALRSVPGDFCEEVQRASTAGERGDLRLLAHEARNFDWASEGLRTVGRAQFSLRSNAGARETFEWLKELRPDDIEVDHRLASIYQRLGDVTRSAMAIQRVIASSQTDQRERAQAFTLQGHNVKKRWRESLGDKTGDEARKTALCAPGLKEALQWYTDAFSQDLNHVYPGLSALSLLCIRNELAQAMPDVWKDQFDSDDDATRELSANLAQFDQLVGAIQLSLKSKRESLRLKPATESEDAVWLEIFEADFSLLTATRPRAVAQRYRDALTDQPASVFGPVCDRLDIFRRLDVRKEFSAAAFATLAELSAGQETLAKPEEPPLRVLLFTGHMVDEPGRAGPRFPQTKAAEDKAREMLRDAIVAEQALAGGKMVGVCGGACGGDILFHEVCAELGIPTRLYLALPRERFCVTSVQYAGPDWVERYFKLCNRLTPRVLMETEELPKWLRGKQGYEVWQRTNLWMLYNALALHGKELTLIALWDSGDGDGPGGTDDLVFQVRSRGYKLLRLQAEVLKTLV